MSKHVVHSLAIAPTALNVIAGLTPHFPIIIGFAVSVLCLIGAIVSYSHTIGVDSALKAATAAAKAAQDSLQSNSSIP